MSANLYCRAEIAYPFLRKTFGVGDWQESTIVEVSSGTVVFAENESCLGFPMVIEGEIAVRRASGDGRFIELYRVTPGEICFVSSFEILVN